MDEGGASGEIGAVPARPLPSVRELREMANSRRYVEAAALLDGVDLDTDLGRDWQYYAGVCLGAAGQVEPALDLLKRSAAGGFDAFWCAYHLGLFEMKRRRWANAAYYLSVALVLRQERGAVIGPILERVAPNVNAPSLKAAQAGLRSRIGASTVCAMGEAERDVGNAGAAVHYFTVALALDPEQEAAHRGLMDLAPDILLDLLPPPRKALDRSAKGSRVRREIEFDRLVCASVLDEMRKEAASKIARVDFGAGNNPIEVIAVERVLYLPILQLQIWRDNILPQEANPVCDPTLVLQLQYGDHGVPAITGDYQEIDEPVCVLDNLYSGNNFYHFFEELFKVTILERLGFRGRYVISRGPEFMRQLLALVGINDQRSIVCTEPTMFREAYFATPMTPGDVLLYPAVFSALRDRLLTAAEGRSMGTRLWIDRRSRGVVNQGELGEILDRYNFTIVDMEQLSVSEQIAAVKQAGMLAGPHGAGFIHAMFLPERSSVIECFSPEHINPIIIEICRVLQHRYHPIVPTHMSFLKYKHGMNVEVPLNQLELVLENLRE